MKHLLLYTTLLLSPLLYGQSLSSAQLDSAKAIVRSTASPEVRTTALKQVLSHYGSISGTDSILAYGDYGLREIAQDSLNWYLIVVYRGFNLGSAVLFTASAAQAGLYLAETQTYIRHARRLAEGKPGLQKYLTAIGSTIRSNIALQHLRSHHYSQADSCYRELVAGFRSQQDTAALIGALSNQSGLYDRMALAAPADSLATRKALETKAYQAIEEAIALARSYLKTHPENSQVLRALLYLLANKSGWVTTNDAITPEEKKELLSLLLETLRLARETEQPGRELLLAQTRMIRLLRVLERHQKALETSAEVLKTCQELNLPDREAAVYEERSDVYWDMGQYDDALSDIEFARQRYAVVNDLAALMQLCERAMAQIDALPALKRHQFRQQRARFEALGQEYRQQAKAAGQVVPGDKP